MVFSSPIFLFFFLPIVLLLVSFLQLKGKNLILLAASLFFYFVGERLFTVVMLGSICWNYCSALLIDQAPSEVKKKLMLGLGVGVNLAALCYFKYSNFLIENLNHLGFDLSVDNNLHLPIGISFFTFQSVSYLVDVYRRETNANKDPFAVGLYVALFPQLIAGPIVRYVDVKQEINKRKTTLNQFVQGIERFIIGLAKKVIVANTLAYVADQVFSFPSDQLSTELAWLGIICYTFQIYFDFSGYSDMAIGIGKMLGFNFLENFNYPYFARSIKDFWRRWHISLSTWFRDYLYIPLGGNRISGGRTYINLLIVFFLTGLWHGASWNFIIWGLFHGTFLVLERVGFEKALQRTGRLVQHTYTMLVVVVGWVFFRATDLDSALIYLSKMFVFQSNTAADSHMAMLNNHELWLILGFAILFSIPTMSYFIDWLKSSTRKIQTSVGVFCYDFILIILFVISCLYLAAGTYNPFIYYRF